MSNVEDKFPMIISQCEVLTQAQSYVELVTPAQYSDVISPQFMSSAGAHIRHIIDYYQAFIDGIETGIIDYDSRRRNTAIEIEPQLAWNKLAQIKEKILTLDEQSLYQDIMLTTEVSISECVVQQVPSSLARELIFVGSHAVHHFAMIKQISNMQQLALPNNFGIAPSTATHLRKVAS